MKVLLIYYTGTYNTRFISEMVKERFLQDGHKVVLFEIKRDSLLEDINSFDLIGFGYPIYGFNTPRPFDRFLKSLKFKEQQRYFIYKNSGETYAANNSSSRLIFKKMKKSKAQFMGEYHFLMPYNIHFPFPINFIKEQINKDAKLIEIMYYNLTHNIIDKIPTNIIYHLVSQVVSIQKIGGDINSYFYRIDKNECLNCHKCIDICPNHNIILLKNKIKFKHHCDMCMRCSFYCPTSAIKIGFLEKWKVKSFYNLDQLKSEQLPIESFINADTKGFYKCYIRSFKDIDEKYKSLIGITKEIE